jgi:Phage integrase family
MHENENSITAAPKRVPWNKGKLIGPRPPLRQKHVWAIRTRLQLERQARDLALFNLAIDSKLRGCDLVAVRVDDVAPTAMPSSVPRQYARLLADWLVGIGLDPHVYGTHSLRRTKATLIYRRTGNLRAVQLLLGHTKIESTVRYLGIDVDDALAISEQVDI